LATKPKGSKPADVLVFRNASNEPIVVPAEVVTAQERIYRCHLASVGGASWEQIALDEGYPSPGAAAAVVRKYLKEGAALVAESSARDMLSQEVRRFDALQHALWPQAMSGFVPAVNACVNIINARARIVGLDPEKMDSSGPVTVVVPPDSAAYMAALKKAAGTAPAATKK
jgi:hypothetical protein